MTYAVIIHVPNSKPKNGGHLPRTLKPQPSSKLPDCREKRPAKTARFLEMSRGMGAVQKQNKKIQTQMEILESWFQWFSGSSLFASSSIDHVLFLMQMWMQWLLSSILGGTAQAVQRGTWGTTGPGVQLGQVVLYQVTVIRLRYVRYLLLDIAFLTSVCGPMGFERSPDARLRGIGGWDDVASRKLVTNFKH